MRGTALGCEEAVGVVDLVLGLYALLSPLGDARRGGIVRPQEERRWDSTDPGHQWRD